MSLLPTLLGTSSGGGAGSNQGVILSPVLVATVGSNLTVTQSGAGTGATLTNAGAQAAFQLDGVTPSVGARILIKDQSTASQNGVYTLTNAGSVITNWVLTRATDFDQVSQITVGVTVEVSSGTVNAATEWVQTATVATVDTDSITFSASSVVGFTASRAVVSNSSGKLVASSVTSTELGYLSGVTSALQGTIDQTTTPVTLAINTRYQANNAGLVTFNMPATVPQGSRFEIDGYGAGGWLVQMNTGQVANLGASPTSSAGSLASSNRYNAIEILCTVANTTFTAYAKAGNITVA